MFPLRQLIRQRSEFCIELIYRGGGSGLFLQKYKNIRKKKKERKKKKTGAAVHVSDTLKVNVATFKL